MAELVNVKGLSDLQRLLDTLPAEIEAKLLRGALRAGAKVVLDEVKQNTPVESGELRDGLKISTTNRRGVVTASIKARGKHGFIAPFLEYGTAPHLIKGKKGGTLSINGKLLKSVEHPGLSPKPFFRPALDARAQDALMQAGEYLKRRLGSTSKTGFGLDTSGITIEEDDNED